MNTLSSTARVMAEMDPPSAEAVGMAIDADLARLAQKHCADRVGMSMATTAATDRLRRDVICHLAQTDARLAEILRTYFDAKRAVSPLSNADLDEMEGALDCFTEAAQEMAGEMLAEARYWCGEAA